MFIWPFRIKEKVNSMKSNIEKIDHAILSTKIELDKIEYDLSARLKGAAWRSV